MDKKDVLKKLFISMFFLSAFTFGGGYVIVSLMKKKFVDEYHWIDENEMMDLVAIAQSAPGVIAVNGSIVIGYKLAGVAGLIVCIIATILPPFFIISLVSFFYNIFQENHYIQLMLEGMQAGVGAVVASVSISMGDAIVKTRDRKALVIMFISFTAIYAFKINVIYVVLVCIAIGIARTIAHIRRGV